MRRTGIKRLSSMRRSKPKAGTASGIPTDTRLAVLLRDKGMCRRCGRWLANVPSSVHHRLPRGRGGDARLSGLVSLCGTGTTGCHGEVESDRAQAYDDGWLIHTGRDPQSIACLTPDGWLWLDDEGGQATDQTRRNMP